MLEHVPEMRERLRAVIDKYKAIYVPPSGSTPDDRINDLREAATYFVENPSPDHDPFDPFLMIDLGAPIFQMARFRHHLPRVQPHYAVKCNPSMLMLELIHVMGGSFDCASLPEIDMVMSLGAAPQDIIFAHPHKTERDMYAADALGVQYTTFDSETALKRMARCMPHAQALLRIRTNDAKAQCSFSSKFGASMEQVPILLEAAKANGVRVVGVAFHVGSGNNDASAYISALQDSRVVFDCGLALGFDMKILDLGGGLPGVDTENMTFEDIADVIRPLLDSLFPTARVIAEPGRFFATAAQTVVASIHGDRTVVNGLSIAPEIAEKCGDMAVEHQYFIGDGTYHSFNCIYLDHAKPSIYVLRPHGECELFISTLWGPTCDSMDCLVRGQLLPRLQEGDWLFFPNMGAYTTAAATDFNGYSTRRRAYISSYVL